MSTPPPERLNGEDFAAQGPEYEDAWEVLVVGCTYPPSLEVFRQGFKDTAKKNWRGSLTIGKYADGIVKNYRRIR